MKRKLCPKCHIAKPFDEFPKNKSRNDGLGSYCKICQNQMRPHHPRPQHSGEKPCSRCHVIKPLEQFPNSKRFKDGHSATCKKCMSEYHLEWRTKNRTELLQKKRDYYQSHKKQTASRNSIYHQTHKEQRNNYTNTYLANHPEKRLTVKHKRRAQKLISSEHFTASDVKKKLSLQNGRCFWCKCSLDKYHVDHVVPLSKGGDNSPSNIVLACPRCNLKKKNKSLDNWLKIVATF